jgi:phosphatidyl-myo-inositol dimannoside synthase
MMLKALPTDETMSIASDLPIYVLTHEFFPKKGGIATFTEEMARAAVQIGHKVEVWAPRGDSSSDSDFPFAVRRLKLKGSQDLSCQIKLAREWIRERRKLRKAMVYLSDPGPILAMCYLQFFKAFKPARLVITFHGSEVKSFASNPIRRLIVNQLIKRADRISAPSEFTHGLIRKNFPAAKLKTYLTPGALRSNFERPRNSARRSSDKINILTVGRLHPRKGQAFIMEALADLPLAQRKKVSFWIVGTGNKQGYGDHLKALAKKMDFGVSFYGEVSNSQLEELYARASIFSMTSVNFRKSVEGFGLVYLEAAAHGLPIVANRVGGVAEAVSHGENGLLVDPGDKPGLTQAFDRLIQDHDLREKMGKNGLVWSRRNNWVQSAELLFNQWDIQIDPRVRNEPEETSQTTEPDPTSTSHSS